MAKRKWLWGFFSIGLVFIFVLPFWQTLQNPPQDSIEFGLDLIFNCLGEVQSNMQLSYKWTGTHIEELGVHSQVKWRSAQVLASGTPTDSIQEVLIAAFDSVSIIDCPFFVYPDGSWEMKVSTQVKQHITVGIDIFGLNDTVRNMLVHADLEVIPQSVKNELAVYGVDWVTVTAHVFLQIQGAFFTEYLNNLGYHIQAILDTIQAMFDFILGTIEIN